MIRETAAFPPDLPCGLDQIRLDHQIVVEKFGGVIAVRKDAANLGCGDNHCIGAIGGKPGAHGQLFAQIGGPVGCQDVAAFACQPPHNGRADHALVTCHIHALAGKIVSHQSAPALISTGNGFGLHQFKISEHHLTGKIARSGIMLPAELFVRFGGIAQQQFHFGRAEITRIDFDQQRPSLTA